MPVFLISLGDGVVIELMPQNRGALVAIFETTDSEVTEYSGIILTGKIALQHACIMSCVRFIEWSFKEDKCWLQLHGRKGFDEQVHVHTLYHSRLWITAHALLSS